MDSTAPNLLATSRTNTSSRRILDIRPATQKVRALISSVAKLMRVDQYLDSRVQNARVHLQDSTAQTSSLYSICDGREKGRLVDDHYVPDAMRYSNKTQLVRTLA